LAVACLVASAIAPGKAKAMKARSLATSLLLLALMVGCGGGASSSPDGAASASRGGSAAASRDSDTPSSAAEGDTSSGDGGETAVGDGGETPVVSGGESTGGSSEPDPGEAGSGASGSVDDPIDGGTSVDDPDGSTDDGIDNTGGTEGTTEDGSGGTEQTEDGSGGTGETDDGSGGTGATDDGSGGTGNTDDGSGGTGNTDDGSGGSGATGDGPPPCFPTFMDGINVLVFEDATLEGADTEGRLLIGGDAVLNWSMGVAVESENPAEDRVLIVGGDLTWTGGSANGLVTVGSESEVTMSGGATARYGIERNDDAFDFEAAEQELTEYSQMLTQFPTNGTVTSEYTQLTLTGTHPEVNTFTLTAEDLQGITKIVLEVPDDAAVIINVTGTDVALENFGFNVPECKSETGENCHMIIWNLYEAETVTISGVGLQGTLLAPQAAVEFNGGMIDGQLIVRSLTGNAEHHPYMFTGCYELEI
jgi:choice-of-anchor A domain-containing protein